MTQVARCLAALVLLGLGAGLAQAQNAPIASWRRLPTANGYSPAVYDLERSRIVSFREHLYRFAIPGQDTRELCFDTYFGVRTSGSAAWLGEVALSEGGYLPATGIIRARQQVGPLSVESFYFSPFSVAGHALVMLARVQNTSGQPAPAELASLHNFHVGDGDGADNERIVYDAAGDLFREQGQSGRTMIYAPLLASGHHAAGAQAPANPYQPWKDGAALTDSADTGLVRDAVAAFSHDLGTLAPGQSAWTGAVLFYNESGQVADETALLAALTAMRQTGPEALLAAERADWQTFMARATLPADLTDDQRAVAEQQLAFLRMGQVAEPDLNGRRRAGALPASLPPGYWDITWVRDMSYALAGLARVGLTDMAEKGLRFFLAGRAGNYQCCDTTGAPYVGRDYALSIARYSGQGDEETDFNGQGPNIEFDGFGLFLWAYDELVTRLGNSAATAFVSETGPGVLSGVADVIVALQEPSTSAQAGLLRADSSVWEHHWDNGGRRHFTYSSAHGASGLRIAARLAGQLGDTARQTALGDAAERLAGAIADHLVDPATGILISSSEELSRGPSGYMDASVVEAFNRDVLPADGQVARDTLDGLRERLFLNFSGRGFKRADDGDSYDEAEWVVVDLWTAVALMRSGRTEDLEQGLALIDWVTAQAKVNHHILPELFDPVTSLYAGQAPMLGFGAGMYLVALDERSKALSKNPPPPTDGGPDASPGDDGGSPDGGSGGDGGPASDQGSGDGGGPRDGALGPMDGTVTPDQGPGTSPGGCAVVSPAGPSGTAPTSGLWLLAVLLLVAGLGPRRLRSPLGTRRSSRSRRPGR